MCGGKHFDQKQPSRKGFIYPPVCEPLSREDRAKTTQGGSWRQEPNRQWRKHHLLVCSCSFLRAPWTTSPGVAPPTVGCASSYQSWVNKACHWLAWGPVWGDISWIWVLSPKIVSACFKLELEDLPAWREFLLLFVFICGKNLMSLHDCLCLQFMYIIHMYRMKPWPKLNERQHEHIYNKWILTEISKARSWVSKNNKRS